MAAIWRMVEQVKGGPVDPRDGALEQAGQEACTVGGGQNLAGQTAGGGQANQFRS
jgi:hypothetical protein